jgi:hypothetical protein
MTTSTDYLDPERLMRAAVGRVREALERYEAGGHAPDVLAALERAHYRIETAQREIANAHAATYGREAWDGIADAVGSTPAEARGRFTDGWLGR